MFKKIKSLWYNGDMKRSKWGFTIIEVAIFLAVTGALFVGVTVGVNNAVNNQRKNDTVQSFVEFLRGVYSQVTNVQHEQYGRSGKVVYGKLVTFGEGYNFSGEQVAESGNDGSQVFVYTMIGNDLPSNSGNGGTLDNGTTLDLVKSRNATVVDENRNLVGLAESYNMKWAAKLEQAKLVNGKYEDLHGALLIVRHPETGTVYTYFSEKPLNVNGDNGPTEPFYYTNGRAREDVWGNFKMQDVDFCINTTEQESGALRTDVRVLRGAKNASGVELPPDEENRCNEE